MGGSWLGGSVRGMVRSLVLRLALMMAVVAAVVLAVVGSAGARWSVQARGEYVDYVRHGEPLIGPFADLQSVFHPGGVGPAGVPCTADTVAVVENEVVLSFDPVNGSLRAIGFLELSCEFHPGCGAVTRTMDASYLGEYDAEKELVTGTVSYETAGGESTNWGTKSALNPVDQCLDRFITEGRAMTTNWVLNVGEENPTGYQTAMIEGDDPAQRFGFFTFAQLITLSQGDASTSTEGDGESAGVNAADSGDEASSASREAVGSSRGGRGAGMLALVVLLGALLFGAGMVAFFIHRLIQARMGFRE
jgi:hypothetical protein